MSRLHDRQIGAMLCLASASIVIIALLGIARVVLS